MNDKELVVFRTQTEHAESKDETEGSARDKGFVAVRVEQRSTEARETELEECLNSA